MNRQEIKDTINHIMRMTAIGHRDWAIESRDKLLDELERNGLCEK